MADSARLEEAIRFAREHRDDPQLAYPSWVISALVNHAENTQQSSDTRYALARLDVKILEINAQLQVVAQAELIINGHKRELSRVRDELLEIRKFLRPILDSSAPTEVR